MSLNPEDRFYEEVFIKGIYNPVLKENCDVVLDVGALAGEFSIWIEDKARQIYAIEPEDSQFVELEENTKIYPNIYSYHLALSNKNGIGKLIDGGRGGHKLGIEGEKSQEIETKTLATFIKDNRIDHVNVLKIDIENGEEQIFCSEDFSEVADKIDYIIGEHLDGKTKDTLIALGFEYEPYEHGSIFRRL